MKLQRLRVEQLRLFRQSLEIPDFTAGINLFSGPNESGKSSLVRAIRAAFFERHRSSSVDDLQPWGDTSAAPEVELEFEHEGQVWHLIKRFLQKKRCDLTVDGQDFSGEEAEGKLAALFGFEFSGSGASKAKHWGIPGLLWIEQGQGQEVRESIEFASDHLKSALGATLGEIASTSGDDIIRAVEELRSEYLTKTGRPTGEYKEAEDKLVGLEAALQELNSKITNYQSQVDRLGELRQQHARDEAERPWESLQQKLDQAKQQYAAASKLSEQQVLDNKALNDCQQNIQLVSEQLKAFQKQAEVLQERQQAQTQAQAELEELQEQQAQIHANLEKAKTRYLSARDLERKSREQHQRQSLVRENEQYSDQKQKLSSSLENAKKVQLELSAYQKEQSTCRIDAKDLKQLRKLDSDLRELKIQQQSIATRMKFELQPGKSLLLDGQALEGAGERLLLEQAELEIAGIGKVQIIPGGEDLGELVRNLEQTQDRLASLLQKIQVDSVSTAEERAERYRILQATITSQQQLLQSHAPEGTEALEAELKLIEQQSLALQERLAELPESTADIPSPKVAEQQLEAAEAALKATEAAEQQYLRAVVAAEQQANSATAELTKLQTTLADPQRAKREQENSQRLIELRANEVTLNAAITARTLLINDARPDILQQDMQRFENSANQSESTFRTRKVELARLEAELSALGAQGLEEERAKQVVGLEALTRRQAELKRRAEASSMLLDLLREKRQVLTRRLQAPLQRHLNHYLQLLFPQASLEVDENLIPGKLIRAGIHGTEAGGFEALSFGAREQMGLISRLAYADLLKEAGKPTLIILDDALVHSDEPRLQQMKRIIFDAGQRHQILLFTCHPEKWMDMGVPVRELASLGRE